MRLYSKKMLNLSLTVPSVNVIELKNSSNGVKVLLLPVLLRDLLDILVGFF